MDTTTIPGELNWDKQAFGTSNEIPGVSLVFFFYELYNKCVFIYYITLFSGKNKVIAFKMAMFGVYILFVILHLQVRTIGYEHRLFIDKMEIV